MDRDVIEQIETCVNGIIAEQRAHRAVLLALVGQATHLDGEGRKRLEEMRSVAEQEVGTFEIKDVEPAEAREFRRKIVEQVGVIFDEIQLSLRKQARKRPEPANGTMAGAGS